ncbi:hypothetical protein KR054_010286 [Drosophila jambulina]|nr:hypothetical protein KR054_010286 [Drosophila jambulina]
MEVECDLGDIQNEELLRKMWQQSEDSERKKQIRSHLYKLRESRLCNLYRHEPDHTSPTMSETPNGNGTLAGYGAKGPLASSHGDALLDQNFQSLKSKEVRDSTSPTHELRFHSMTLTQPNTTGWDVQTSSEVSPDGRAYRTETLAKTDGVEKLNGGGLAEFKGRNEQRSSASHQGDDKNFVKQASESSKTQLQEKVVFGDESSGRTEMKMSSTSTSSSSKVVSSSSSTVEYGDEPRYLLDGQEKPQQHLRQQQHLQQQQQLHQREWEDQRRQQEQRYQEQLQRQEQQIRQEQIQRQEEIQRQEQLQRQEERFSESREQSNTTRNVQTQQHYEENKRYVDMDKASPEYQQHVQHLMSQPGEIISNTVEYPKPNVKMITTVKRLPDGTIVKNKRYETEQLTPSHSQTQTHNQTTQHQNQAHNQRRVQQDVQDHTHSSQLRDVVDNVEQQQQVTQSQQSSFSSVKKSSRRFSTETTSETVEEYDDRGQPLPRVQQQPQQPHQKTPTPAQTPSHHAPSQPSSRQSPGRDFSTHGFPSVRPNKPTQEYPSQRPTTEEVVVVRSEKSRQVKQHQTTSTETEVLADDYHPQSKSTPQKLREAPGSPSFSTHGFPSVRSTPRPDQPDGEVPLTTRTVSRNQSANRKTNTERIIETQVEQPVGSSPRTVSPRRSQPREAEAAPAPTRGPAGKPSQNRPTTNSGSSPTTKTTETVTVTRRQLQKEREVDAAHRAFAASLRSSSPAESTTSVGSQHHHPHHHQTSHHQTPRSSISSNRTYRRDMREGSHESQAPSETSRISSSTVTRHTTGGTTTSTTTKTTKKPSPVVSRGPSEPRSPTPKSGRGPSEPRSGGGTVTTTTTTTTSSTIKGSPVPVSPAPAPTPASPAPDNKLSQYTYTTTKPGDIFSLPPTTPPTINNEPTLTTTTTTTNNNNQTTTKNQATKKNQEPGKSVTENITEPDSQPIRKLQVSANEAKSGSVVAEEAPCVRRHYYQLGQEGDEAAPDGSSGTTPASKKPHPQLRRQSQEEPEPQLRRSSKSPGVQRETTFEGRRVSQPVEEVQDQLDIEELIIIEQANGAPKAQPSVRASSPEKGPRATPRQSPEKEQPGFKPSRVQPQVSPRQSPEKQTPDGSQPAGVPEKQVPRAQSPEKGPQPRVSPRQSPEKQQQQPMKPRQSPERMHRTEDEIFRSTITTTEKRTTHNLNEEFLTNERDHQTTNDKKPQAPKEPNEEEPKTKPEETIESPDGGFLSKGNDVEPEPEENKSPTYRKKGLTRRETFEDRCRKILGMEEDGDTQGNFTQRPENEDNEDEDDKKNITQTTTIETIEVKIEDCPDDDDDDQPRRVTETFVVRTQPKIKVDEELLVDVTESEEVEVLTKGVESPKYPNEQEQGPRSPKKQPGSAYPKKEEPSKPESPRYSKEPDTQQETPKYSEDQESPRYPKEPEHKSPKNPKEDAETINVNEETTIVITKQAGSKSPSPERRVPKKSTSPTPAGDSPSGSPSPGRKTPAKPEPSFVTEKIIDCQGKTVVEKITQRTRSPSPSSVKKAPRPTQKVPEKQPETESEPEKDSEPEIKKKTSVSSITKTETERRNSRTTKGKQPLAPKEPQSKVPAPKSPRKDSLTGRKRDSVVEETRTTTSTTTTTTQRQGRKPSDTNGTTPSSIKDRLRSSPRKQKTSPQPARTPTPAQSRGPEDNVDGDSSSPDASPSRVSNERRRSSNISVHTEIIIDHTAPKSPRTERRPQQPTVTAASPIRKLPVTERKESAPVPRVTRRDKTEKVTRSTSENIIKVSGGGGGTKPSHHPEMSSLKPGGERTRPSKCCTTKTINLSEQRLHTSTDIEGVIIDIQQAKSSREPSPDRIVPTPVPAELDTGKPRYPDVVQEPDDEPRRKPQVTNIPIFEEESQAYVGCQISELRSSNGLEVDILDNPTVEAPKSLDYPVNTPDTDESLLSVHEKVSRFTHSAEKVKQPRASAPFSREFDTNTKIPENDDCLLSINQKVDKFLRTAENVTRPASLSPRPEIERPNLEEIDEELLRDDCILSVSQKVSKFIDTAEKLAPTVPQKSPRLVANIERHISRQSEPERDLDEESEPELERETDQEDGQTSQLEEEEEVSQIVTRKETVKEVRQQETRETIRRDSRGEPERAPRKVPQKEPEVKPKEETTKEPRHPAKVPQKVTQWEPKQQPQRVVKESKPTSPTKLKGEPERLPKREPKLSQKEPERLTKKTPEKAPRKESLKQPEEELELSPEEEEEEEFGDEPLPMTKTHTTAIELKRQKDILSRPSVFNQRTPERRPISSSPSSPTKMNGSRARPSPSTSLITEEKRSYRNQVTNVTKPGPRKTSTPSVTPPSAQSPSTAKTTTTSSKRMEHITQQQWVVQDVDVDVEVVGPAPPSHTTEKPQRSSKSPTPSSRSPSQSPSRSPSRRTSNNMTTTTEHRHPHPSTTTTKTTGPKPTSTSTPTPTNPTKAEPEITPIESVTEKSTTTITTTTTSTTGRNVANRRNVFEPAQESPSAESDQPTGRRPSYMDHTKSSLEHIRRDSLEINKSHYSRKSSVEDDSPSEPRNPNTAVKFDVPRKTPTRGGEEPRKSSLKGKDDDSDLEVEIEEIFDLQRLEQLLETVASYEMRRRIRAQMRLIRKNMINAGTTTITTTTSTGSGKSSPLPKKREPSPLASPESKVISGTLKEVRTSTSRRQQRVEQVDSTTSSPGKTSPYGKPPVKPRERSASPAQKRRISPPGKPSPASGSTTTKVTTITTTTASRGAPIKSPQGPIWADRSKVLKGHAPVPQTNGNSTPRKGSTSSTTSSSGKITRTMTSSSTVTSSSTSSTNKRNKPREEDSITSSYGVGPTDENGLPLFGIRALKKKTAPPATTTVQEPCETKQEVTGYVIEEQFYSDNKSPPRHERKELIYSSNADELAAIKQQLQQEDEKDYTPPELDSRVVREFKKVEAQSQSLPEDAKYVRRGSVKELSEKFIRKESSSSTHSTTVQSVARNEDETEEDSESNEVCSVIEAPQMRQNQSHVTSTTRSSNTRSFLNSSADQRQVTSVDDVLERMRNADNVEEPGDSSGDREARALLNKFLGASVIMQGVESMLPPTATGQRLNSQGVKTTRITHNYSKSGNNSSSTSSTKVSSSSAPVTRTTCDIEEIWDEQVLKQLLEQASTYEERRKIRARLRELMAEREEQKKSKQEKKEEEEESSASEYEEIIEEVTDYSDEEEEEEQPPKKEEPKKEVTKKVVTPKEVSKKEVTQKAEKKETSTSTKSTKVVESVGKKLAKVELASSSASTSSTTTDGVVQVQGESQPAAPTKSGPAAAAAAAATSSSSLGSRKHSSLSSSQVSTVVRARDKAKTETMPVTGSSAPASPSASGGATTARLSVPSKEDSGTESGEDLRLLAAGLRDTLQQRSSGSDASEANRSLVEEVTDALSRLESSLKQGKELAVDGGQRQALLGLVARLQSGLSAPDKLADKKPASQLDEDDPTAGSPEPAESSDCRQSRFAKRRQRNSRHTVGVSREELADARRYMEDMLMLESKEFALTKTPSSGAVVPVQLYRPNQFVAAQQQQQQQQQQAQPQSQSQPESPKVIPAGSPSQLRPNPTNRRPLSGDYAVSFASYEAAQSSQNSSPEGAGTSPNSNSNSNSNSSSNSSRFGGGKRHMMKRANTIDIPKAKAKYMADCDSDSDLEDDQGPHLGLKRAVQVSVKRRVHNAVPPFEPKTENDHKFLAFINKQSHQTGLGWGGAGGRSVSNWTHKFGNIKHTFETGAAATVTKGKPPPVPGHLPGWAKQEQMHHQQLQRDQMQREQMQREQYQREQRQREQKREQAQREQFQREQNQREQNQRELSKREQFQREQLQREQLQREQLHREKLQREQLQREQLQREQLQREQLQREQLQRDQLQRDQLQQLQQQQQAAAAVQIERQRRQELERQLRIEQEARYEREERTRLEREYYEQQLQRQQQERQQQLDRQRQQQEQLERQRRQEMELRLQQQREQAAQVNNFIHAPQSVFRPIEHEAPGQPGIYKPIAQKSQPNPAIWKPPTQQQQQQQQQLQAPQSQQHLQARSAGNSYSNTPSPSSTAATSPIGLPWVAKPKVDNSDFRRKAHHFEERSLRDNLEQQQQQQLQQGPSYPNGNNHGYLQRHNSLRSKAQAPPLSEFKKRPSLPNAMDPGVAPSHPAYQAPPPPTNISFTYADFPPVRRHGGASAHNYRSQPCLTSAVEQAETLTNPLAAPLVLTSSNPTYLPPPPQTRRFDYISSPVDVDAESPPNSPTSFMTMPNPALMTDNTDDDLDLDSDNNMLEYRAETKVMRKPRSQTAVRVADRRNAHMSDDEVYGRNSRAAKSLLYTMKQLGPGGAAPVSGGGSGSNHHHHHNKRQPLTAPSSPKAGCLSPDGRQYQAPLVEPLFPQLSTFEAKRQPQFTPNAPPMNYQANPTYTPPRVQTQSQVQDNASSYLGETHTSYVVTYPVEDSGDEPEPESLAMSQRLRRTSEHSNASSSLSLGSTSWTANPVHNTVPGSVSVPSVPVPAVSTGPPVDRSTKPQLSQPAGSKKVANQVPQQQVPQQQHQQVPQGIPHLPQQVPHQRPQPAPQQLPQQKAPPTNITSNISNSSSSSSRPKLSTRSHTIQGDTSQYENRPLQNRIMSQQTLITTQKLQQKEQQHQQQQQQQQQHVSELRRKSLGNVLESSQRSAYFEQEYKSSAPSDTPDIVKSSLPKEDAPLLKKFGPPQRHHYVPNAYQSPQLNKQQSGSSSTTITSSTTMVQQQQQIKPSIVETPATPQPQVPPEDEIPHNIVFNNVSAFTSLSRRNLTEEDHHSQQQQQGSRINRLSKCDSWNQICQLQATPSPSGRPNPPNVASSSPGELRRTKSGHSLAVPKLYEAGIDKSLVSEKQRTVAAYFSGQKSPNQMEELRSTSTSTAITSRKSAINRTKTSEKLSAAARKSLSSLTTTSNGNMSSVGLVQHQQHQQQHQQHQSSMMMGVGGLSRSATMPHIANLNLLDESNVEDAFEQLMMAAQQKSSTTSEQRTETKSKDGGATVTTTTTKVTTRTVSGNAASKNISPLAKFKQLDKQAAAQQAQKSSPTTSTPTTPGGSAQPYFKFTDPALNARAATVKDQLLQWCQHKTQEYENVQISNFSSSWSDGLAFCALIHHFLPDAFDYTKLTKQTRRHNFELAFSVADEKAGIAPLLDVEDMVEMSRPDWKCVFVYVQSIYRRFRNCQ